MSVVSNGLIFANTNTCSLCRKAFEDKEDIIYTIKEGKTNVQGKGGFDIPDKLAGRKFRIEAKGTINGKEWIWNGNGQLVKKAGVPG